MRMTWKQVIQILCLVVALGAGLRLYNLGNNSFVADEFLDMNSSYGYFQTGTWQAWDFNFGKLAEMNLNDARDERAFIYKAQVAALFHFLSPTESNARLVSVFWGIFSILVMFWTGYFYTKKRTVGLIAAFLFAVSVSGIILDRRLRMYAMFFPVFLLFATAVFATFERAYTGKGAFLVSLWKRFGLNPIALIFGLALGICSLLTHGLTVNVVPISGAYLLLSAYGVWRQRGTLRQKYAIVAGSGIVFVVLTLLFFPETIRVFTKEITWFDNHYSYFSYFFRDFSQPLLAILLAFFGAKTLWKDLKRPQEALFLCLATLIPLALAVWFWRRNVGAQYIFFAQSFLMLLVACGVYGVLRLVREQLGVFGVQRTVWTLALLVLLLPNYGYFMEENNTYHETSTGGNPNYRKVFDYFKKNMNMEDVLLTRNFRNYYWSGAKVPVMDFGGELSEAKLSLAEVQRIVAKHPHGWVILSTNDYDYISHEAELYFKKNMEQVSNAQVRGAVEVYRW